MTDTDKLEPGWYWVKWRAESRWAPAEFAYWWRVGGQRTHQSPNIIGPRLTPPGEG